MVSELCISDEIVVLITGAGGGGTIELIKSLKKLGGYRIIATDANKYSGGFAFADKSYLVPFATDKKYQTLISNIVRLEKPHFIIPLVDEEIMIFHEIIAHNEFNGISLLSPSKMFCALALDKWETYRNLFKANLPTPYTCIADDVDDDIYPAVVKPRFGRGSREIAYLSDSKDLKSYINENNRKPDDYIVQEKMAGKEYTVSVVVGLDGVILAVVPKEVLIKRGITLAGVTRKNAKIEKLCYNIQDLMNANGPINVQLFLQEDGIPRVTEINPRYSTTVALTLAAGINEVDVVIRHALGYTIEQLEYTADLVMVRYHAQEYMLEKEWSDISIELNEI